MTPTLPHHHSVKETSWMSCFQGLSIIAKAVLYSITQNLDVYDTAISVKKQLLIISTVQRNIHLYYILR